MATVYIGGASIDERGKASGGQAGNQSGRELRRQAYYDHAKEWYVFRAKSPAVREDIALAMERAIANRQHRLRPVAEPDFVEPDQRQGL